MSAPKVMSTVADTMRALGTTVGISLQPCEDHSTGELWCVSVNHSQMGMGETLEAALANLAFRIATANGGAA